MTTEIQLPKLLGFAEEFWLYARVGGSPIKFERGLRVRPPPSLRNGL